MFYLVSYQYAPSTASTSRVMAYVKALSELGIITTVVFFMPNLTSDKVERVYPHIRFAYMWDKWLISIPRINKLSLLLYIKSFIRGLRENDTVMIYGFVDLVVALKGHSKARVYAEFTEHPEAAFTAHLPGITISRYLKACASFDGVFVISHCLKQYFLENGCQSSRVHVINMVVDTTRFDSLCKQLHEPYIAYCGTASNSKDGVDLLIKAFALVVQKHPNYKLLIIGRTPPGKQRFENLELVKRLSITNSVVFTGIIQPEKMPQVLMDATVLALARPNNLQSKYGFPTKLGEYLLTGNPVVITRVGDIPLFLKDGESALIADPNDEQGFADKLCWAIEHPIDAIRIGEVGKQVAKDSFNYLTETKKIVSIASLCDYYDN